MTSKATLAALLGAVIALAAASAYLMHWAQNLKEELRVCTVKLEEKDSQLSSCRERLTAAEEKVKRLEAQLKEAYTTINDLERRVGDLTTQLAKLNLSYMELEEDYRELQASYDSLLARHEQLGKAYESTLSRFRELNESYRKLLSEYHDLSSRYAELSRSYSELENRYDALKASYDILMAEYGRLKEDYSRLKEEYEKLMSTVYRSLYWLGFTGNDSETRMFYSQLLRAATNEVKWIVDLAEFSGSLPVRAFDVLEDTLYWLSYCSDGYVRYPDPYLYAVNVTDHYIMLPNETWRRGCGDCEDLALFVYGLLAATAKPWERVFIVAFHSRDYGHVAVLAVDLKKGEYYVIDPAGNYLNGISIYYRLTVEDPNGTLWYLYLDPNDLSWNAKEFLVNFTVTVYYDNFKEKWYNERTYYVYMDAFSVLQDWIVDYWGIVDIEDIVIAGENVYKEFNSIIDAAKWLEGFVSGS